MLLYLQFVMALSRCPGNLKGSWGCRLSMFFSLTVLCLYQVQGFRYSALLIGITCAEQSWTEFVQRTHDRSNCLGMYKRRTKVFTRKFKMYMYEMYEIVDLGLKSGRRRHKRPPSCCHNLRGLLSLDNLAVRQKSAYVPSFRPYVGI